MHMEQLNRGDIDPNTGLPLKRKTKYELHDRARAPVTWTCAWSNCHMPANIDTYAGCTFGCKYCFTYAKGSSFFHAREDIVPMSFNEILSRVTRVTHKGVELPKNDGAFQRYKWAYDNITYKIGVRYDPLPGLELRYRNTLKTLKLFEGKDVVIQTKNPGILRGEYLDTGAKLIVHISLGSPDNFLEEKAPPYEYRFKEGLRLMESGVRVAWRLSPAIITHWTDDDLIKLFETDAYKIISCSFFPSTPKELQHIVEPCLGVAYLDWVMALREMSKDYAKPVHFTEDICRCLGSQHCLPDDCKVWHGTVFDKNPVLPEDVKIHPIKRWEKARPIADFYPARLKAWAKKRAKFVQIKEESNEEN